MRLVEQQQLRLAHQRHRECEPAPLAGGEPTVGNAGRSVEGHAPEHGGDRAGIVTTGRTGEEAHVLLRGQVVVAVRLVADESGTDPRRATVGGEIVPAHRGLAGVGRHEAGEEPQQRRLARAVRAGDQHDLARADVEIDAGQRREASEQGHDRAEPNHLRQHEPPGRRSDVRTAGVAVRIGAPIAPGKV